MTASIPPPSRMFEAWHRVERNLRASERKIAETAHLRNSISEDLLEEVRQRRRESHELLLALLAWDEPSATSQWEHADRRPMPRQALELRHLAEAEKHVDGARRLIAGMEEHVGTRQASGIDVGEALGTLSLMKELLATFVAHRDLIARTVEEIDAGKR